VSTPEAGPLWREVLGDAEPRRRGREAIIVVSVLILLGEVLKVAAAIMGGDIPAFFVRVVVAWFVALLLYFVWIGQNWARWLLAPVFGINGCWDFIWGIVRGDGLRIVVGLGELIIFCYLAISPAVYAFAREQRERINRWEVVAISGVFILVLGSVASAILAFYNYQNTLKAEATEFASLTFHRVFENRDPEYLAEHSSKTRKYSSPQAFINRINGELGEVRSVGPIGTSLRLRFVAHHFEMRATAKARVIFDAGPLWVSIEFSGREPDWEIEHISWNY
jgi:hypothetical protein